MDFLGGAVVKNLPADAEDASSIPGSGRSPGEGNGNPLQYSCPRNPVNRGTWRATVYGTTWQLNNNKKMQLSIKKNKNKQTQFKKIQLKHGWKTKTDISPKTCKWPTNMKKCSILPIIIKMYQNYNKVSPHMSQNDNHQKICKQ